MDDSNEAEELHELEIGDAESEGVGDESEEDDGGSFRDSDERDVSKTEFL